MSGELPASRIKALNYEKLSSLIEKTQDERGKWRNEDARKRFLRALKVERISRDIV